ncbi:transcription factor HES-1-like isoform X2 [Anabas testudineus]|uniref:transcription factor HES-1-like isoform X2 n=1 Tax=Anabas testudineus TaxID=64144 RepID=UPI000E45CB1A|nr:transcription factor HES-1-like isoform X2 [Anabas testudineus]
MFKPSSTNRVFVLSETLKMPTGTMDRTSPSAGAASPASGEKPRTQTENRKSSKPIMEKRRRARINESLGQLKTLILDALKKDSSRHSKLEKADILEMTVKHLSNLQRLQITAAVNTDSSILGKYRAGFNECVGEVTRFLSTCEGVDTEMPCKSGSTMHVSPEAMKLYGGFQVVPTPDGQFAFLVPSAALAPLSSQSSHHGSPVAPPVTSDSVWRPW